MNKRGADKILSVWWLFVLIIIGLGIVGGVILFHSAEVDVRGLEAQALVNRLQGCIVKEGKVDASFLTSGFDVYSSCGIYSSVAAKDGDYFFKISLTGEGFSKEISGGDSAFEADCKVLLKSSIKARKYPSCFYQETDVFYEYNGVLKKGSVKIIAASNQIGKNEGTK